MPLTNLLSRIVDSLGNAVSAFPATFLRTTDEPHQLFYDPFDGALDTTNYWSSSTGSSGVAASTTTGTMSLGTGTTANGYSKLASIPTFKPTIPAWLGISDLITIPDLAAPTANSFRFWGEGTTPATPSTTTPLTDAIGFELSTAGKMFAVVYAGGTRTAIQDLSAATGNSTQPTDASAHRYIVYVRTDKIYWYIDGITSANLVATSNLQAPQVQTLPKLFLAVGGPTPPVSNSQIQCTGATAWDTGKNNTQVSDGTYPWRKASVTPASALAVSGINVENNTLSVVPTLNNDLLVSTDVSNYADIVLQITGTWTGTFQVQWSNDNFATAANGYASFVQSSGLPGSTFTANTVGRIIRQARYMRVRCTVTGTGTATGVIDYFTTAALPPGFINSSVQNGNWNTSVNGTPSVTTVSVTTASTSVLGSNASRKGLFLSNVGANNIYVNLAGGTAITTNLLLLPNTTILIDRYTPATAITAIAVTATTSLSVTELT